MVSCPQNDVNTQTVQGGFFKFNAFSQACDSESASGLRKNSNNGGHKHCLFVAGLWSKHSLFNHSFRRFLELVQPTTAHVVPEPLFLDTLSIRFHTVSASISEIPSNINLSPPERKWKAYTGGVKEVERKRVKNLSIQRSRRV